MANRFHAPYGFLFKFTFAPIRPYRTFNQAWNTAKKKAENALGYEFNCTFHDIKAKSISDYEGSSKDKQIFSGHKTESQVAAYDRNVKITPTLTPKKQ